MIYPNCLKMKNFCLNIWKLKYLRVQQINVLINLFLYNDQPKQLSLKIITIILIIFPINSFAQNINTTTNTTTQEQTQKIEDKKINTKNQNNIPNKKTTKINLVSHITPSIKKKNDNQSLMFEDKEIRIINEALDAYKNNLPFTINNKSIKNKKKLPIEYNIKSYIYLGSILYQTPNNWSTWINGQKISSSNNHIDNDLYIKSISANHAKITWKMSISKWKILTKNKSEDKAPINFNNQVEFNFTLGFNQTFILNSKEIVEGEITTSNTL